MIPGSNLLNMAFQIIAKQTVTYYQYASRVTNDIGIEITTYEPGIILQGSFQPVPRQLYAQYGLDFQKSYFTFYVSANMLDVQRNVSGDQISFNGARFQCESNVEWFNIDGWVAVLCVQIEQPAPDDFVLLDGTHFTLLDGTDFELLGQQQ